MNQFMKIAIDCAEENYSLDNGKRDGGPFGAVIVKDGQIIAKAHNSVSRYKDPTRHAEIEAIQEATRVLGTTYLRNCEIYCTCFPCPMCLGAIYWAQIPKVFYGSTSSDSSVNEDTDDTKAYNSVFTTAQYHGKGHDSNSKETVIECVNIDQEECRSLLNNWSKRERKR